jgi:hypothetical protein
MPEQPQTAPTSLGKLIDKMYNLRNEKLIYVNKVKDLTNEMEELQSIILQRMEMEDMEMGSGSLATVRRSESIVPSVQSWDEFENYILKNDALYLLERRPASGSFRELNAQGITIPGVTPFTKIKISLTKKAKK